MSLPPIALPLQRSTNSLTSDVLHYAAHFWLPLYILDFLFYQVGPVLEVLPAPIQANNSEESNYTIIYSISEGIHFFPYRQFFELGSSRALKNPIVGKWLPNLQYHVV